MSTLSGGEQTDAAKSRRSVPEGGTAGASVGEYDDEFEAGSAEISNKPSEAVSSSESRIARIEESIKALKS